MVHIFTTTTMIPAFIFVGAVAFAAIIVILVHCVAIGKWHLLSPIRKPKPTYNEGTAPAIFAERTPLLERASSKFSIANSRSTSTPAYSSSLPQFSTFDAQHLSATRLGLPPLSHSDLETRDPIAILDSCVNCSPCPTTPPSLRLYAFPNTQYVGLPGLCFAKNDKWDAAVRWVKNGGKWVEVRFWMWDGREMMARIGLAEEGNIEVMGMEDVLTAMEKGKSRA